MQTTTRYSSIQHPEITRKDCLRLLEYSLKIGNFVFCQHLAQTWLDEYQGDLLVRLFYARALSANGNHKKAAGELDFILQSDPAFVDAWVFAQNVPDNNLETIQASLHALGASVSSRSTLPFWSLSLRSARTEMSKGRLNSSGVLLQKVLSNIHETPLIALIHLDYLRKTSDLQTFHKAACTYADIWPRSVEIQMDLADSYLQSNNESKAMTILMSCVRSDIGGQIINRTGYWGKKILALWPKNLSVHKNIEIPADVKVSLNWPQLPDGQIKTSINNKSNDKSDVHTIVIDQSNYESKTFKTLSTDLKSVYVILTSETNLIKNYGEKTSQLILEQLSKLANTVSHYENWESILFLPDNKSNCDQYAITALSSIDPWKVKLALSDLAKYLESKYKCISAILIVGGDQIIPMHGLPNPTDDSDAEILSDNPYGTLDMNYFSANWPVGRIIGEKGSDAGLLLQQIRSIIDNHEKSNQNSNFWDWLINALSSIAAKIGLFQIGTDAKDSFGYSASVWKRSSIAAFRPLGNANGLRVSPPYDDEIISYPDIAKAKHAYFNLHGLPDTPDWYGQRDSGDEIDAVDYPVAISAKNIALSASFAQIVFSEACYGGFLENKSVNESVALAMIDAGTKTLIASTGIAYGSITTPLIGADLLAFIFWKYVREGYTTGEAFIRAKDGLIKIMLERQGYLDGEDQKSIISFVLFGDPLFSIGHNIPRTSNMFLTESVKAPILVNDKDGYKKSSDDVKTIPIDSIKELVKGYLPGMQFNDLRIREHQVVSKAQSNSTVNQKNDTKHKFYQMQFTRKLSFTGGQLRQFIRVTVDENGKIMKFAVSR